MDNYAITGIMADPDKKEVLRDAMKTYAEDAKNQLSFKDKEDVLSNLGDLGEDEDGEEIELDLTITQEQAFNVMRPLFQKAVDICKNLLQRNHLTGKQVDKLILVGGPTHSPLIRQMLRDQVTENVDTSIDPMTAVAVGAALFASTIDADSATQDVEVGTIRLEVGYESTSVETTEWVSMKLADDAPFDRVWVELVRGDNAWSSGKVEVDKTGNVLEANLIESKPNSFAIKVYDERGTLLPSFPEEITIIQGTKVGAAPLPYNIGIAVWSDTKKQGVFRMAKGLEKNKPVPAIGVVNNLKISQALRPGVESDKATIPVSQVDDHESAEGRLAYLYEYVGDVIITGDDIDEMVAADALVDITIKVDSSEQMTIEAHFLATDQTVEKSLDTNKKHSIAEAEKIINNSLVDTQRSIRRLAADGIDTSSVQAAFEAVKQEAKNSSEKKAVLQHLKEVMRKVDELDNGTEWQRLESEIREQFEDLEKAQRELGNDKTGAMVEQLRRQTDTVIRRKDVAMGHELLDQIHHLYFQLTMVYQCIGLIEHYHDRFGSIRWSDMGRARQLINQGMQQINDHPTVEKLLPIAQALLKLLPPDEQENANGLLR